jgi:hypothetical protein
LPASLADAAVTHGTPRVRNTVRQRENLRQQQRQDREGRDALAIPMDHARGHGASLAR